MRLGLIADRKKTFSIASDRVCVIGAARRQGDRLPLSEMPNQSIYSTAGTVQGIE